MIDVAQGLVADMPTFTAATVAGLWVAGGAVSALFALVLALWLWRRRARLMTTPPDRGPPSRRGYRVLRGVGAALVLGPITGPLFLGFIGCVRAKRPWMASVYALGIVETIVGLPLLLKAELDFLSTFT